MKHTTLNRRHGLDTLRGITLISMIAYHARWDLVYMFGKDWSWYRSDGAYLWQQSICWTFILLSGYCWSMGRHRLRRGLMAFGGGVIVSVVTLFTMPDCPVICGVLTLLGSAAILTIPLESAWKKIPSRAGLAGSFLLFLLLRDVNSGYLGFEGMRFAAVPRALYSNYFTAYLGFPQAGFASSDYFPLLPWFFLFLTGSWLGQFKESAPGWLRRLKLPLLNWLGRHSLMVYLVHQPVLVAISMALALLTGRQFAVS